MTTMIENLLALAKADQGIYQAEFSEVDLRTLVEELYAPAPSPRVIMLEERALTP